MVWMDPSELLEIQEHQESRELLVYVDVRAARDNLESQE